MKVSPQAGKEAAASGGSLSSPAIIVVLVLLLGAIIYLWRARYIRRRTAYAMIAVLVIALVIYGGYVYTYGG